MECQRERKQDPIEGSKNNAARYYFYLTLFGLKQLVLLAMFLTGDSDKEDESAQTVLKFHTTGIQEANEEAKLSQRILNKTREALLSRSCLTTQYLTLLYFSTTLKTTEDDYEIPPLEDIHEDATDGIFTHSSYDDEGAVADFINLETIVNVSPIPTSRVHPSHPTELILGDPTSTVTTRSKMLVSMVSKSTPKDLSFEQQSKNSFRKSTQEVYNFWAEDSLHGNAKSKPCSNSLPTEAEYVAALQVVVASLWIQNQIPSPRPSPNPSPTPNIPDSIPEHTGENLGDHSFNDTSLSGNEDAMTLQNVYDLCISLCKQVSDQAKEIKLLKAKITKLKKKANPVIKHFKAYQKRISKEQRQQRKRLSKKKKVQIESVSKQGGRMQKGDVKQKKNAQRRVNTDFGKKVSTDNPKLSTDDFKVSTDDQVDASEDIFKGTEDKGEGSEERVESTTEQRVSTDVQKESTEEQTKEEIASQASQTSYLTPTIVIFC
ncbi:hypothetical protein Tco_0516983 [Tanacetum coccineum]